jgi:transcriptional regulator with PAS, ATPase and Fis domain
MILFLGVSGTGKDLVAKAIHRNGPRASKPYITVNCGAIPEALIESELFGAERGAFTGASALRKGLFESAHGGTIFLDEVSELPLALQPTLLRVLQNREVWRLGGTRAIPLDFRLIAASNRDLAEMVEQGRFRADLYHRLRVVSRIISPLRDRLEDVPVLAQHFVTKFAARSRPGCRGISKAALRALSAYAWPGNVRELENAIERAIVLGNSSQIELEDLPETLSELPGLWPHSGGFHEGVATAKRQLVQDALDRGGTFVEAAKILKVHPNYLHRLVNALGLRRPD